MPFAGFSHSSASTGARPLRAGALGRLQSLARASSALLRAAGESCILQGVHERVKKMKIVLCKRTLSPVTLVLEDSSIRRFVLFVGDSLLSASTISSNLIESNLL
jgi:hypothetical protein